MNYGKSDQKTVTFNVKILKVDHSHLCTCNAFWKCHISVCLSAHVLLQTCIFEVYLKACDVPRLQATFLQQILQFIEIFIQ